MANINFGIDLGTTNSLVAKFKNGSVEVFRNPSGLKETLPSVVAFRQDRVIIGDKAREYMEKDPGNVFGFFKRKMGTSETFEIQSLRKEITPVELSSLVLRELRNFIYTGEKPESVVITIPASFDTMQSNATKKAGYDAGFREVVLLQEPIAASLAYANKEDLSDEEGKWLVFDLGGGTFDVALVSIANGEMNVVDHEGNNFLGGMDFDNRIIDRILVPALQQKGAFPNLVKELRSRNSRYNKDYYRLLKLAEDTKIALSHAAVADIEFEIEDDNQVRHELYLQITREQFEQAIKDLVEESISLVKEVVERNQLRREDLKYILLVGGSTYVPYVRQRLAEATSVPVNAGIDPTTAVAVGAAYFAGNKRAASIEAMPVAEQTSAGAETRDVNLNVTLSYPKTSKENKELLFGMVTGDFQDCYFRILREDGGYDSGIRHLTSELSELLPLLGNTTNIFQLQLLDKNHQRLAVPVDRIEITQGKYNITGQPLPNDICLEVDDKENGGTKLELIFEKGSILPLRKTITKSVSKSIGKGSDQKVVINVLEGSRYSSPESCLSIGTIVISGKQLPRDLVKGSDVELVVEMSESRDLNVSTYLMMTDQEYSDVFNSSSRKVSLDKLRDEIRSLKDRCDNDLLDCQRSEQFEIAAGLKNISDELDGLKLQLALLKEDDMSDVRYQLDEKKRYCAKRYHSIMQEKRIGIVKALYFEAKNKCRFSLDKTGTEAEKSMFEQLVANEREFLAANNPLLLRNKIDRFDELSWQINQRDPTYIIQLYLYFSMRPIEEYTNTKRATELIKRGEKALERQNYDEVKVIMYELYSLLPQSKRENNELPFTGIS